VVAPAVVRSSDGLDVVVELACDEPFEAADRVAFGVPFADASFEVGDGWCVPASEPDHDDRPERGVRATITGAVESSRVRVRGRHGHGCGAAQRGETRLGAQPFGIVTRGAEQRSRNFVADTVMFEQQRSHGIEDVLDRMLSPDLAVTVG
jgi:hypothetical protein